MKRRDFAKALAAAGATLAASRVVGGPATSDMRSNFAFPKEDTPLARMALERGGSFRVGLEDWGTGPSNLEQMARAKELINRVGRPIVSGAEAIKYLDIPFATTTPKG